jgi:hypothetical protein
MRRTAFAAIALLVAFAAAAGAASARTYNHGHTVWFSDLTIGDGDEVRGDLEVIFGSVTCSSGGVIDGSVRTYFGDFTQLDGCRVGGRVTSAFDGDAWTIAPFLSHGSAVDTMLENRRIFQNLAWDVVALFAFLLFPVRVRVSMDRVERHPAFSALAGAIALVAVVPLFVILLLTIIGIPLVVLEFAALFAGIWIGFASIAMLVGRRLYELVRPHATPSPLVALVIGMIVVNAAQTLPFVGWAVTALVCVVGLGAAVLGFWHERHFGGDVGGVPMNRPA